MSGTRELLIVRHAPAEEFAAGGDRARALTAEGRAEMTAAAAGLARIIDPPDLIATSPLVRAQQTADLLAERFSAARRATLVELEPGFDRDVLASWLDTETARRVMLVGHEPDLSALVGWLIAGVNGARIRMRKGAIIALALRGETGPHAAELEWSITRGALRRLGEERG